MLFEVLLRSAQAPKLTEKICDKCGEQVSKRVVVEHITPSYEGLYGTSSGPSETARWEFKCNSCGREFTQTAFEALGSKSFPEETTKVKSILGLR